MADRNVPALVIVGIAGLCVSAAIGVGVADYTMTGLSPVYTQHHANLAYADDDVEHTDDDAATLIPRAMPVSDPQADGGTLDDAPKDIT